LAVQIVGPPLAVRRSNSEELDAYLENAFTVQIVALRSQSEEVKVRS
jgi:hypothetical protein